MVEEINAGMEPEKPKGISTVWAIVIIVVIAILIGGGIWYWYYKTAVNDTTNVNIPEKTASTSASASTSALPSTSETDETANWKTYSDDYLSFKYDPSWKSNFEVLGCKNIDEGCATLSMSTVWEPGEGQDGYADISYCTSDYNSIIAAISSNPNKISEASIKIDGVTGKKIVTKASGVYMYNISVPISSGNSKCTTDAPKSFGLEVWVDEAHKSAFDTKLNLLINSIVLKVK